MTTRDTPALEKGETLAHYCIEAMIGEGSMGVVYRAHDTALDRPVGLKVLRSEVSKDERFVRRFVREARAAARVSHPNLTHIYFVGEQDERHFFAMELIEGQDLQTRVEEDGPIELAEALDIVIQAARGLGAAHRAGVVHRDVKPSNILLQADGVARITDFGLAMSPDADLQATLADTILGTPLFMSPEQCQSVPVDARTDIYALGLTTFYLLTGRLPFEAKSLGTLINEQINKPLPSIAGPDSDLPTELDRILGRMCAKKREDRHASMEEVIRALESCHPRPVHRATLATRAAAAAIDMLAIVGVAALADLIAVRGFSAMRVTDTLWGHLALTVLFFAYQIGSEARWGATLGKWMLGIQVVTARGMRAPARTLVPRFLLRYPFNAFDLVFLVGSMQPVEWLSWGAQILLVLASIVTYVFSRQRSVSDLLTGTRVAVRLVPEDDDTP